jgi:hypothetical protein
MKESSSLCSHTILSIHAEGHLHCQLDPFKFDHIWVDYQIWVLGMKQDKSPPSIPPSRYVKNHEIIYDVMMLRMKGGSIIVKIKLHLLKSHFPTSGHDGHHVTKINSRNHVISCRIFQNWPIQAAGWSLVMWWWGQTLQNWVWNSSFCRWGDAVVVVKIVVMQKSFLPQFYIFCYI